MKVFSWNDVVQKNAPVDFFRDGSAVTVGGFDGPHKGHEALFSLVFEYKSRYKKNIRTGVITFTRSPGFLKNPSGYPGDLTTSRLKLQYLESRGFDFCVMIDFSYDFSKIKGSDFLTYIREFCSMQFLAAGSDFRCGHNLDTGVAELADYMNRRGLEHKISSEILFNQKRISSSQIRAEVQKGNFSVAGELLGYPYCLDGSIFSWSAGSSQDLPSIVADRKELQVLPESGKYPVKISFADKEDIFYDGLLYVESNFLRLEVSLEQSSCLVNKIVFV